MIEIVQDLLGGNRAMPSRQIFYGMIAAARIKVLRSILEEGPLNATKDDFYDKTIDEYKSLNKIRNDYIHGLWYTHASGRLFISERTTDDLHFMEQREVELKEIEKFILRMGAFVQTIRRHSHKRRMKQPSSPQTPSPRLPSKDT